MTDARTAPVWFDALDGPAGTPSGGHRVAVPRLPLDGDTQADVVVVGAGLTGLWTAYYLLEADPSLDVVVVEQGVAGWGASGCGGGWCSARFPVSPDVLAVRHGLEAAVAMRAAMRDAVVEVGGVAAAEEIACDFVYGGTVGLARNRGQLARLTADAGASAQWGDEVHLLDAAGVAEHVVADGVLGGTWTPDCAQLQPVRLVRGLVDVVTERGARLVEHTRAVRLSPRAVVTDQGTVRARYVVRATGAWPQLPGIRRQVAAVESRMIATEPLPSSFWDEVGLTRGQTFSDGGLQARHGRRTADDRIVLGGRLAYRRRPALALGLDDDRREQDLRAELVDLFPGAARARVTHSWGSPLAVPRDRHPSVGYDEDTQTAWAGGYGDDGVATSNLAGRTIADLVTGSNSPLVRLPWVGHRSPSWAAEPLRRVSVSARLRGAALADLEERVTGHPSRVAGVLAPLLGG